MNTVILSTSQNEKTNNVYYFCQFGSNRKRRITKQRFRYIESFSKRSDSFLTKCKGNFIYQDKTVYLDFNDYHFVMTA